MASESKFPIPRSSPAEAGPVWKGPEEDGVTYSLLARFLQCPRRFQTYAIRGLRPRTTYNHKVLYGTFWHACEEYHALGKDWEEMLFNLSRYACMQNPMDTQDIDRWYRVCRVQFPIYLRYWGDYDARGGFKAVEREKVFDVKYHSPSGRVFRLRGRRDGVYLRDGGERWLFETKTKGDVDEGALRSQLTFDLQTMMYLVALRAEGTPAAGVYYNVVRRPLSGGRGTIVRHKARGSKPEETWESYQDRLRAVIDGTGEDSPGPSNFFFRWVIPVTDGDILAFEVECLNPVLERLHHWYLSATGGKLKDSSPVPPWCLHWRMPYGVNLPLLEGGVTDYDEYLRTGSTVGLDRVTDLFTELR